MKIIFLLCLLMLVAAEENENNKTLAEPKCEEVKVRDKMHRKEVIGRGLNRPYQLGIQHYDHKIYFTFNEGSDTTDTFGIGYLEKNHTGHKVLEGITNGFAIAIDNDNHVSYFGGSDGIYKLHAAKDSKVEKILHDHNIWDMFYKKELYYINYPEQLLYKLNVHKIGSKPERVKEIHEKIYQFVIDKDGDRFITNATGLYRIKRGSKHRIFFEGPKVFRAIELNNKGEAFFSGQHHIYSANNKIDSLEEIVHVPNVFGLAFSPEDTIFYSDPHEIIKLVAGEC